MGRLALLFIIIPAVELVLLVQLGARIGGLATFAIIVATGIAGAALAKRQGADVIRRVQSDLSQGRLPAQSLVDGALVLVAGVLLITPGILTDITGFLLLLPPVRAAIRRVVWGRIQKAVDQRRIHVVSQGFPRRDPFDGHGPVIDVEPERNDDDQNRP
jgi:UPF0716 protein FxsA